MLFVKPEGLSPYSWKPAICTTKYYIEYTPSLSHTHTHTHTHACARALADYSFTVGYVLILQPRIYAGLSAVPYFEVFRLKCHTPFEFISCVIYVLTTVGISKLIRRNPCLHCWVGFIHVVMYTLSQWWPNSRPWSTSRSRPLFFSKLLI
jgi:hypothetical protein